MIIKNILKYIQFHNIRRILTFNLLKTIRNNGFLSNFFKITSANYLVLILGIGTSIIINRNLSYDERGSFALILTVQSILVLVISFGLPNSINYLTINLDSQHKKSALLFSNIFSLLFLIIISAFVYLFLWNLLNNIYKKFFFIIIILIYSQIMFSLKQSFSLASQNYKYYATTQIVNRILSVLGVILVFLCFKFNLTNLLYTLIIAQLVMNIVLYFKTGFKGITIATIKATEPLELLKVGFKNMFSNLLAVSMKRIDIFVVEYFLGNKTFALYAVALFLYNLFETVSGSAGVILANKSASNENNLFKSTFKTSVCLTILISCGFLFFLIFGNKMIVLLYTEKYSYSYNIFIYLMPSLLIYTFIAGFANVLAGKGYPKRYVMAHIYSLIFSLFSHYFLTKYFGIKGIALSLFLVSVLLGFLLLKEFKRRIKEDIQSDLLISNN